MAKYYETLEVKEGASATEIRQAYRRLALRWHPDKNPKETKEATRRFKEISEAYQILSDARQRESYDRDLRNERRQRSTSHFNEENYDFQTPEEVFAHFFGATAKFPFSGFPFSGGDPFDNPFFSNMTNGPTKSTFTGFNKPSSSTSSSRRSTFAASSSSSGPFTFASSSSSSSGSFAFGSSSSTTTSESTCTTTRSGKSVTTKTTVANGIETIKVYENGRLISETTRTINGKTP